MAPGEPLERVLADAGAPCDVICGQCTRNLAVLTDEQRVPKKLGDHLLTLREASYCRWCARPITAEAEQAAPLDGYVRIARLTAREVARHHPAAAMLA